MQQRIGYGPITEFGVGGAVELLGGIAISFPQGIYFRATDNQTDPTDYDAEVGTTANYPRTSAQGNSVGFEQVPDGTRDRDTTTDVRLKGLAFFANTGTGNYRIDLPATGDYKVRLAAGDSSQNQLCKVELFDTTTSKGVLANQDTVAGNTWLDATDVKRTSESAWVNNNALSAAITFASTICRFRLGGFSGGAGNSCMAAIYIESAGGAAAATRLRFPTSLSGVGSGGVFLGDRLQ